MEQVSYEVQFRVDFTLYALHEPPPFSIPAHAREGNGCNALVPPVM